MAKTGYVSGSDMLLYVGASTSAKAIGHCTSHTTTFATETKDRAVKPLASATMAAGLWKGKGVTGLSITITAEGLCFYDETEYGFAELLADWKAGAPVTVKCMERAESSTSTSSAYLEGSFVITNVERTDPAQDDATYSLTLENNGEPTTLDSSNLS